MATKTLFTAHAKTKGGRNGKSQTTDGRLSFDLATPGGPTKPNATNPEELFACGYSACFGSAVEHVAKAKKLSIEGAEIHADVSLNQGDDGFFISVALHAVIPNLDQETAEQLVQEAHQVCPYSKATRGNVDVKLSVNNHALAEAA